MTALSRISAAGSYRADSDGSKTMATDSLSGLVERVTYQNAEKGFCVLWIRAQSNTIRSPLSNTRPLSPLPSSLA
jgi:hypothetical protein